MKTLCAFAFCLVFAMAGSVAKQRHCTFRVHAQANARDTEVFATSVRAQVSGKTVAIEKTPWISERDVIAFSPYPAANGTHGALFQLDEHGRVVLDTLSVERRGSLLSTLTAPGLWLQKITTKPPSDDQTAIAIHALNGAMAHIAEQEQK